MHRNWIGMKVLRLSMCIKHDLLGSGLGTQRVNGSPVKPGRHEQIGLWFTARHMACKPQIPGQGSTHCWFTQDLSNAHWALIIHSGWQSGGAPKYPDKHEQTGWFSKTWHSLYKPHGDGRHGLSFGIGKYAFRKMTIRNQWKKIRQNQCLFSNDVSYHCQELDSSQIVHFRCNRVCNNTLVND